MSPRFCWPNGAPVRGAERSSPVPGLPLTAACCLVFAVSGGALWLAGLNYEGLSGGAASKIHPSTYLFFCLFAWRMLSGGDPYGYLVNITRIRPASMFLLVAAVLMLIHIVARGAPGMAGDVDTYMGAALGVMLMAEADERTLRRIEASLHAIMTVNALTGLGEFLANARAFPYRFDGEVFATDLRSTALQGHPLVNATVTAWYVLALIGNARFSLPAGLRAPLIVLQFAAMVTFGGRTALVIALALGAGQMVLAMHRSMRTGKVSMLAAAAAVATLACAPLAGGLLVYAGFFDRLAQRFADDGGSANARILMFELFDRISLAEFLVGPDAAYMDSIRRLAGLEWGIESPIIRTMLYQGAIMTALLTLAVALFLWELSRVAVRGTALPMLCFVLVINTSESIGGKTTMLTKFAISIICLYRPQRRDQSAGMARPSAEIIAGSSARLASSIRPMPSNRFQNAQAKPAASAASRTSRT